MKNIEEVQRRLKQISNEMRGHLTQGKTQQEYALFSAVNDLSSIVNDLISEMINKDKPNNT